MSDHTTLQSSEVKTCSKCKQEKPLSEYHRNRRASDGLHAWCKACVTETNRAWHNANRERVAERNRAWRIANPERNAEKNRAWAKANPEKRAELKVRNRARHPERFAARDAVSNAVAAGKMLPASDFTCACGAPAEQYHHHKGYSPEHALDVMAVCRPCHTKLDHEAGE